MTEKVLIPRVSSFFPSFETRVKAQEIVKNNPPEKFQNYKDWFFFIHIDPAQRYVHSFGMVVGTFFFAMIFIEWSLLSILYYLLGVFFFYGFGLISHFTYDKGQAKSHPRYFHLTIFITAYFNFLTLFGMYDKALRRFIDKYPFTTKEFDLIEVKKTQLLSHLLTPGGRHCAKSK